LFCLQKTFGNLFVAVYEIIDERFLKNVVTSVI